MFLMASLMGSILMGPAIASKLLGPKVARDDCWLLPMSEMHTASTNYDIHTYIYICNAHIIRSICKGNIFCHVYILIMHFVKHP